MTQLEQGFKTSLRQAVLDAAEDELRPPNSLVADAVAHSHQVLRRYGDQYDVEPVIRALNEPTVERQQTKVVAKWGWEHEAAPYFESGTSDHVVDGNPILSFVWEDPPQWVKEEFDQGRDTGGRFVSGWRVFFPQVEVSGIDQTRFVRAGIRWLTNELRGRGF